MFAAVAILVSMLLPVQAPAEDAQVLPGEFMFPVASKEVWKQTRALVEDLGFGSEKTDDRHQMLVTTWRNYSRDLLEPGALGLEKQDTARRIQLHLAVAAGLEPARVAVGVILEFERVSAERVITTIRTYRHEGLARWLLAKLADRLGSQPVPLANTPAARARQAATLMPGHATQPCVDPSLMARGGEPKQPVTPPRKISDVRPIYPGDDSTRGSQAVIKVGGLITEHGTIVNLEPIDLTPATRKFAASAIAAAGLWRFEPAKLGGCPVPSFLTIGVNYTLR